MSVHLCQFGDKSLQQAVSKVSRVNFIFMCFCAAEWASMILIVPGLGPWNSAMLKTHAFLRQQHLLKDYLMQFLGGE